VEKSNSENYLVASFMYQIEMQKPSEEFALCWQAAGRHLSVKGDGAINWLKADLTPPFLEHLSFRLGNQIFFVRLIDQDGITETPGSINGLNSIAKEFCGHACFMPMRRRGQSWEPVHGDWGLIDAQNNDLLNPIALVSDEPIEMTKWEIQDFAVQIVKNHITSQLNKKVMSSQGNPDVHPSLWFEGDDGPEWVVVQVSVFPDQEPINKCDIDLVAKGCAKLSERGHVANIGFINANQENEDSSPILPLLRGHGTMVKFEGLKRHE
jgi:hypothetical protein